MNTMKTLLGTTIGSFLAATAWSQPPPPPPSPPQASMQQPRVFAQPPIVQHGASMQQPAPIRQPTASLFQRSGGRLPTLQQAGYTFIPTPPPRQVRKHDIVTIRVDHVSRMISEGEAQRRKTGQFNAVLAEWIRLVGGLGSVKPDQQSEGDPAIDGQLQQTYRAQSDLESRSMMQFNIAAEVVDIYPNGNVVLEAHRSIENNEESWDYSLSGYCRKEDINPNTNTVLSRDIAALRIRKRERGAVRDGVKRGWLLRLIHQFNPF